MVLRSVAVALAALVGVPPVAVAARGWRAPVAGAAVAAPFAYLRGHPFAAGQRRDAELRALPGAVVRAPCAGPVSFAGRPPAGGRAVSVRCGRLTAIVSGLGRLAVGRGRRVAPGAVLGRLGAAGLLRLGARVTADRWGWIDPLALLAATDPPGLSPAPAPRRGPGARRPPRATVPHVAVPHVAVPQVAVTRAAVTRAAVPRVAVAARGPAARHALRPALWAGVALLAAGLGAGGVVRRRSGRGGSPAPGGVAVEGGGPAPRR